MHLIDAGYQSTASSVLLLFVEIDCVLNRDVGAEGALSSLKPSTSDADMAVTSVGVTK